MAKKPEKKEVVSKTKRTRSSTKKSSAKRRSVSEIKDDNGVIDVGPSDDVLEAEIVLDPEDDSAALGPSDSESSEFSTIEIADELSDGSAEPANSAGRSSGALVPYNPLDAYLSEIRRFRPMTREEEHEVAVDFQRTQSKEAAYRLVSSNLWLVVKLARDYERVARNLLDLIQEGNIGLMEAVKNFDPYRGVRFPSYAVWWIRAYIIRYIIANWRMVKIGTTQAQRKLFFNLKKEQERLEREGIYPSPKLLAERLNVKEGEVVEMAQRLGGSDMSVDAPLQDESESSLLSVLAGDGESAEDVMAKKQLQNLLRESIDEFRETLSDKERLIFQGRVLNDEKSTLQELSDQLSLSKERVRQIENRLREKLRVFIASQLGSELEDWLDVKEPE